MIAAIAAVVNTALLALAAGPAPADGAADGALFSAAGYRIARYRAPLPDEPPAGRAVSTAALAAMIERDRPLLIDVQAVTVRPETEEFGLTWLPSGTRHNLPGSTWLPNVGHGRLAPRMLAYLRRNLERLTGGDKARALVFYCVVDCWMSWNAVKRAAELGYRNLYWYPEGTDGWREAGLPLQLARPQPLDADDDTAADCVPAPDDAAFFACAPAGLPAALARVAEGPGLVGVLLFFESADCPFCQRMRRGLLRRQDVIEHYRQRFVVMPIDLDSPAAFTDRQGRATTQAQFARDTVRVYRTPTLVFLDGAGAELFRHAGIIVDPRVFLGLADYVSGGHYQRVGLREFLAGR